MVSTNCKMPLLKKKIFSDSNGVKNDMTPFSKFIFLCILQIQIFPYRLIFVKLFI